MQQIDINELCSSPHYNNFTFINEYVPNDIIIIGKIKKLFIINLHDKLDLSLVDCDFIIYENQKGESIKNHILPNNLKKLSCDNNKLTCIPKLPNSLIKLLCYDNKLTCIPKLPNSLEYLACYNNKLKELPDISKTSLIELNCSNNKIKNFTSELPNSLKIINCSYNKLIELPILPDLLEIIDCSNNKLRFIPYYGDSLKTLDCSANQITELPEFKNKVEICFIQENPLNYLLYNENIILMYFSNLINVLNYPYNPICTQEELNNYMKYQLKNKMKSAKK